MLRHVREQITRKRILVSARSFLFPSSTSFSFSYLFFLPSFAILVILGVLPSARLFFNRSLHGGSLGKFNKGLGAAAPPVGTKRVKRRSLRLMTYGSVIASGRLSRVN